jgi:predicted phosphodiesterase
MRYALLADIHANLQALKAVLAAVEESRVDRLICLGDVVGYGANPGECIKFLRDAGFLNLMGNHDHFLTGGDPRWLLLEDDPDFKNHDVVAGIRHARAVVRPEEFKWLAKSPMIHREEGVVFAHAALHGGTEWPYLVEAADVLPTLRLLGRNVGIFGHTHLEKAFSLGTEQPEKRVRRTMYFPPKSLPAAITIGSVGQPRRGDGNAQWALWDTATSTLSLQRTSYDIAGAAHALIDAGLPAASAVRLFGAAPVDEGIQRRLCEPTAER